MVAHVQLPGLLTDALWSLLGEVAAHHPLVHLRELLRAHGAVDDLVVHGAAIACLFVVGLRGLVVAPHHRRVHLVEVLRSHKRSVGLPWRVVDARAHRSHSYEEQREDPREQFLSLVVVFHSLAYLLCWSFHKVKTHMGFAEKSAVDGLHRTPLTATLIYRRSLLLAMGKEKVKVYVIDPTYRVVEEDGKKRAVVHLWCRLEDGRSALVRKPYEPYFFIREDDAQKAEGLTGDIEASFAATKLQSMAREPVVRVTTAVPADVPKLRESFEKEDVECFEADVRFAYRAMMDFGVHASFLLEGEAEDPGKPLLVDALYDDPGISSLGQDHFPSLAILSFDIESDKRSGAIYCLSVYGLDTQGKSYEERLIVSDEKVKGAHSFPDEAGLIDAFVKLVRDHDPDVITGWNVIDFDLRLLQERARKAKRSLDIGRDGSTLRLRLESGFFRDSSAQATGRLVLDGMALLKNSFVKLPDYKLATAAAHFSDDRKLIEATGKEKYEEITRLYEEDKESLLEYNALDAKLVIDVIQGSGALPLTIRRSLLVGMPLDRVSASIASLDSLYLRELRQRGFVAPSVGGRGRDDEGMGGFVMTSKPGIYDYVIVCDFKSLYPSIMRTFNIDPLMFVPDKDAKKAAKGELIAAPNGAHFRREQGIIPGLIERFWAEREVARKAKDELARYAIKIHMNSIYGVLASPNCRFFNRQVGNAITGFAQKFIKLAAEKTEGLGYEVIYGDSVGRDTEVVLKDEHGRVSFRKIAEVFLHAETKTREGKEYYFVKDLKTLTIDKKGQSVFKPIRYVMRHKTNKTIYRVHFTNHWHIDVTEDHSLIGYVNKQVKPRLATMDRLVEVKPTDIGKEVRSIIALKNIPQGKTTTKGYPKEVYEFMGYFVGDGSFCRNKAQQKSDVDYYLGLSVGKDRDEVFSKLIKPLLREGYIKSYWWSKTRKGDLKVNGLELVNLIAKHCRGVDGRKSIPDWLLYEKKENIASFLRGLFSADGTVMLRSGNPIIKYTSVDDVFIRMTSRLLFLVGISHSVFRDNTANTFKDVKSKVVYTNGSHSKNIIVKQRDVFVKEVGFLLERKNKRARVRTSDLRIRSILDCDFDLKSVLKVEKIPYDDYVYDLEVEDTHRFYANNVLVHNTDSEFINLSCDSYDEAQKLGKSIEAEINAFLKKTISDEYRLESFLELEFEKTFIRFVMPRVRGSEKGAKKRYAGLVRDKDGKEDISFTGLEMVRRDWTDLAKEFQYELYRRVFAKEEVAGFVKGYVDDLRSGRLDGKLVYRKALRKSVDEYTKTTPPHVKAAMKLDSIDSDIIEYVITLDGPEPVQAIRNPIDYDHYIDKQLRPIADSLLGFYGTSFDEQMSGSSQSSLADF